MIIDMNKNAFTTNEIGAIKKQYHTIKHLMQHSNECYYQGYISALEFIFGEEFFNKKDFTYRCTINKTLYTEELLKYFIDIELNTEELKNIKYGEYIPLYSYNGKITYKNETCYEFQVCENIDLFKALCAIRIDSDYMQWFTRDDTDIMVLSDSIISETNQSAFNWHKSKYNELYNHFHK